MCIRDSLQTLRDDGGVGVMNGQVDNQINGRIRQHFVQGGIGATAVFSGEGAGALWKNISGAGQFDLWIGLHGLSVRPGNVATAGDGDA